MIDLIDGKLNGELESYVKTHIEKNDAARAEYEQLKTLLHLVDEDGRHKEEVPFGEKEKFLAMIANAKKDSGHSSDETQKLGSGSSISQQSDKSGNGTVQFTMDISMVYKVAAGLALLVLGFFGGRYLTQGNSSEMDELRAELQQTKELIMMSMMKENSASERIKGVMASYEIDQADAEILDVLINIMSTDDNLNVRLAAVDALEKFSNEAGVRDALIKALREQEYPAVQIRLISVLVSINEKNAVEPLQDIAGDETILQTVRDEAQLGVFRLM